MKEYRLIAWTDLPTAFDRTGHRRMLSDMSHRYMSVAQLMRVSGLRKPEVLQFVELLDARGLLSDRDLTAPDSRIMETLRPLGGWLRRTLGASTGGTLS
jgi:hypothetical protein